MAPKFNLPSVETYHSIGLLLDPVDIVISYVYQFLYFMYIEFVILYKVSCFLIYLKKKKGRSVTNIKFRQYLKQRVNSS